MSGIGKGFKENTNNKVMKRWLKDWEKRSYRQWRK